MYGIIKKAVYRRVIHDSKGDMPSLLKNQILNSKTPENKLPTIKLSSFLAINWLLFEIILFNFSARRFPVFWTGRMSLRCRGQARERRLRSWFPCCTNSKGERRQAFELCSSLLQGNSLYRRSKSSRRWEFLFKPIFSDTNEAWKSSLWNWLFSARQIHGASLCSACWRRSHRGAVRCDSWKSWYVSGSFLRENHFSLNFVLPSKKNSKVIDEFSAADFLLELHQFQFFFFIIFSLIATPGRLLHVVVEMNLRLSRVQLVVFDEADRLFEMGFQDQLIVRNFLKIKAIRLSQETLKRIPEGRQTLLFSATLPKLLVDFAKAGLSDPMLSKI